MPQDLRRRALAIIDQHLELEQRTGRVARMLTESLDWDALGTELAELFDVMSGHFVLEGQGGYMKEIGEKLPHRSEHMRQLERAHGILEETLRQIRLACGERRDPAAVKALFDRWRSDLQAHEAAENSLAEEAFGTRSP